jgi:hypothetical protein
MDVARQRPPPTFGEAVIPIASLIVSVGLSFHLFGDAGARGPNQVALVVATMIALSRVASLVPLLAILFAVAGA